MECSSALCALLLFAGWFKLLQNDVGSYVITDNYDKIARLAKRERHTGCSHDVVGVVVICNVWKLLAHLAHWKLSVT